MAHKRRLLSFAHELSEESNTICQHSRKVKVSDSDTIPSSSPLPLSSPLRQGSLETTGDPPPFPANDRLAGENLTHQHSSRFQHLDPERRPAEREDSAVSAMPNVVVRSLLAECRRMPICVEILHGRSMTIGKRPYMEDTCLVQPRFFPFSSPYGCVPKNTNCKPIRCESFYCGLFDGHNGRRAADYASMHLRRLLRDNLEILDSSLARQPARTPLRLLQSSSSSVDPQALYEKMFVDVFDDVDRRYRRDHPHSADGTTALVCLADINRPVDNESVHWLHLANVGDCRAVLGSVSSTADYSRLLTGRSTKSYNLQSAVTASYTEQLGAVRTRGLEKNLISLALTSDHKPNRPDEAMRIERNGGHVVEVGVPRLAVDGLPAWLAMSRSIGDVPFKNIVDNVLISRPECSHHRLTPYGDAFLVVASDGVWDVLSDQEAVGIVGSKVALRETDGQSGSLEETLREAAEAVNAAATKKGSLDNMTCVVLFFRWNSEDTQ
eukprot:GHVS01107863.1.p1 GENE.GHVS01107863.1~~GHVS01107863.1.p1  ORF type:complete len:495 (-),score=34.64 GHVS01107863.1:2782-4266(-)